MPFSDDEGKDWLVEHIAAYKPASVLDIGAGCGTYANLLRPVLPDAELICVEVWRPYVERYQLAEIYDRVIVADARHLRVLPPTDVVILGDVAEHMAEVDAVALWDRARRAARCSVFLSIPIVACPQGPWEGNPHEAHVVDDWTHARVLSRFPGVTAFQVGEVLGVYEAPTERLDQHTSRGDNQARR